MEENVTLDAVAAIAGLVHADAALAATLVQMLVLAQHAVPAADAASLVLLGPNGRPRSPYRSQDASTLLDEAQSTSGRGPCLGALADRATVRIDEMDSADDVYPEFADAARQAGIASSMSLPITAGGAAIGAVNFYSRRRYAFTTDDEQSAASVVGPIGATVANASAYWEAHDLAADLREAMVSRAVIEQAKGIIMATMSCDADEAFDVLREQSQAQNRKLRDIARSLVDRQER